MTIDVKDLEFGYARQPVLKGITFSLQQGECISILGPNGAGKSTLIKCINGLLKPQRGEITIDRQSIRKMSRNQLSRKLGYVPQSAAGLFPLTVFDMILLGRRPYMTWSSGRRDREKVVEAMTLLKIEHLALKNYNELSGGQQQKVIIARAIAQETDYLLMDEATSCLDIRHQLEVMETVANLVKQQGKAALMIVHDLNLAARYADRILMIKQNKIVASGTPREVLTEKNIALAYEVRARIRVEPQGLTIMPLNALNTELKINTSKIA